VTEGLRRRRLRPNKRLKLAGRDRFKERIVLSRALTSLAGQRPCASGHCARSLSAGRQADTALATRRTQIIYEASDRPRGAEVRIRTTDAAAVAAIHAFLAFQRTAHHAAGHEAMPRGVH